MFKIIFSEGKEIEFEDIIELTSSQKEDILTSAKAHTKTKLNNDKSGLKITLKENQKEIVITTKDDVLSEKSLRELREEEIVQFTVHSIERLIKRYQGDLSDVYLSVIKMIQKSIEVNELAEWKGFKTLSYTLHYHENNILKVDCIIKLAIY